MRLLAPDYMGPRANGFIPGLSGSLFFMVRNTACILVRKGWVEVPLSCLMAVTALLENWMVLRRDISAATRPCCCSPTHNTSAQGSGSSSWNTGDFTNSKRFVNKLGTYPGNLGPPLPFPFYLSIVVSWRLRKDSPSFEDMTKVSFFRIL